MQMSTAIFPGQGALHSAVVHVEDVQDCRLEAAPPPAQDGAVDCRAHVQPGVPPGEERGESAMLQLPRGGGGVRKFGIICAERLCNSSLFYDPHSVYRTT